MRLKREGKYCQSSPRWILEGNRCENAREEYKCREIFLCSNGKTKVIRRDRMAHEDGGGGVALHR